MYFTYYKTLMISAVLAGVVILSSCARQTQVAKAADKSLPAVSAIDQARLAYEQGEYYKARVQVQSVLSQSPDNTAAQQLMADVLDKEIARQKEAITAEPFNQSKDELEETSHIEVKNWLDRSRTLFRQQQYDLALFAAEKVFVYDANNREASLLIDDIKEAAIKSGKSDTLFLSKMYQEEIGERVKKYRSEAKEMIRQNKTEQAQFTLQKILMLEPEDPESLKLFSELQTKEVRA